MYLYIYIYIYYPNPLFKPQKRTLINCIFTLSDLPMESPTLPGMAAHSLKVDDLRQLRHGAYGRLQQVLLLLRPASLLLLGYMAKPYTKPKPYI